MQTVLSNKSHVEGFFPTRTQFPEIINFDITFPYQNSPDVRDDIT